MKVGISRFLIVAVIAGLVLMARTTPLSAQITFSPDFSSATNANLQLNGQVAGVAAPVAAVVTSGGQKVLRVTPNTLNHAAGSAWFTTLQPVSGGFTSIFQFQVSPGGADGFAFVIQNAPTEPGPGGINALGGSAGALGYGKADNPCEEVCDFGAGIPNSLAVEFDTFPNFGWGDPDGNHVAVQSCGTDVNNQFHVDVDSNFNQVSEGSPAFTSCTLSYDDQGAHSAVLSLSPSISIADGGPHTVKIDYEPPVPCGIDCTTGGTLQVTVDGQDVFTGGVNVDFDTRLGLTSGKAYVGFTGGTGGVSENADILSWTFTPHTSTTIEEIIPPGQLGIFTFGSFNYKVQNSNNTALDLIVTANPLPPNTTLPSPGGNCIVYAGTGGNCWGFDVHCPATPCTASTTNLALATSYDSDQLAAFFTEPGFLKIEPNCAAIGHGATATDQITEFVFLRQDPTTKGTSGGGLSCWVATIKTPTPYKAFIQQPINADGSSVFNAKKGVVPVKFTLTKDGSPTCILPPAIIAVTQTAGASLGVVDESTYTMAADSGFAFRVSGCQYIYNLPTSALGPGTYEVDISIAGQIVGSATFNK